jgi:hypothetical protein
VPPNPKVPKPPWHTPTTRDVAALKDWTKERLTVRFVERLNKLYAELAHSGVAFELNSDDEQPIRAVLVLLEHLIALARGATKKDESPIEPLREAIRKGSFPTIPPELADFIHPAKRGHGKRQHKRGRAERALDEAVEDVHFIRELWKREYRHWKRRKGNPDDVNPQGNPPFAEEIAAEFHNVDYKTLVERVRSGKNFRRRSTI